MLSRVCICERSVLLVPFFSVCDPVIYQKLFFGEAGQLGLVPTRPLSQLGLGSTRPGQLGLFIFLMVNRDIIYVPYKKFGRYDLEYAR